jgi:SAM-dependent methyltransferase
MSYPDFFSGQAPDYARYRPRYPAALFDFLAEAAPGRRRAWDCATGSGQAAVDLAARFESVVATDISERQLAHATPDPRVTYARMAAEHAAFGDGSFDLVTVATAEHWLRLDEFFAEARRVLVPGGVLAAWGYFETQVTPAVDAVVWDYIDRVLGADWPPQVGHARSHYRTVAFPFPELEPPELVIETRWTLADFMGYLRTWSPYQRYVERTQVDPVDRIAGALARAWGSPDTVRDVRWPLFLRVGRVPGGAP